MEKLLSPDYGLMVWTICAFLILVFILGKFAWKPMISALNERESGIRKAIEDAAHAKESADKMRAQFEAELARGQAKAQEMLSQAQKEAQQARDQILKHAQEESQRLAEQTRRQLEEDKEKIARDLRKDVASVSVKAAEKILRHSINAKDQDAILQDFFKELDTTR